MSAGQSLLIVCLVLLAFGRAPAQPEHDMAPAGLMLPDVMGNSEERARRELSDFEVRSMGAFSGKPLGTVLEQRPLRGTRVEPGSPVRLVLSLGPRPAAGPSQAVPAKQSRPMGAGALVFLILQIPLAGTAYVLHKKLGAVP